MNKKFILGTLIVACTFYSHIAMAQGMAVNTTGAAANASAILDVQSTSQGMLVPKMTSTQRTTISSPATGLLVWDNTLGGFYFYNGSAWTSLSAPTGTAGGDLTGSYPSPSIAGGAVTSSKIASGTITSTNIASATITGSNIASATIADDNIVSSSITGAKIAANTITTTNLPAGATASTYLRGDNTWATPSAGGPSISYVSSTTTLGDNDGTYIATTACTVSLPASPSTNRNIYVVATAYGVVINTNGKTFLDISGWLGQGYMYSEPSGNYRLSETAAAAANNTFYYTARFFYNGSIWIYTPY